MGVKHFSVSKYCQVVVQFVYVYSRVDCNFLQLIPCMIISVLLYIITVNGLGFLSTYPAFFRKIVHNIVITKYDVGLVDSIFQF